MRSATTFVVGIFCFLGGALFVFTLTALTFNSSKHEWQKQETQLKASLVKADEEIAILLTESKVTKKRLQETTQKLDEERLRASQQRIQESLIAAQQETEKAYLQRIEQEIAKIRFGELSELEAQQLIRIRENPPKEWSKKERQLMRDVGLHDLTKICDVQAMKIADRRGWSKFLHRDLVKEQEPSSKLIPAVKRALIRAPFKELPSP